MEHESQMNYKTAKSQAVGPIYERYKEFPGKIGLATDENFKGGVMGTGDCP